MKSASGSLMAVAGCALALFAPPGVAADSAAYSDPRGDSGVAPDITTINVSQDAGGMLTFRIGLANRKQLAGTRGQLYVDIDSDLDQSTGRRGVDYAVSYDGTSPQNGLRHWTGSAWKQVSVAQFVLKDGSHHVEMSFPRRAIHDAGAFDFFVATSEGDPSTPNVPNDEAFAGEYWFRFPKPPTISKLVISSALAHASAGKVYSARTLYLVLSNGEKVAPSRMTCTLTYAGKTVTPLAGGCRWLIPSALKGKTLRLALRVGYYIQTISHSMLISAT